MGLRLTDPYETLMFLMCINTVLVCIFIAVLFSVRRERICGFITESTAPLHTVINEECSAQT